MTDYSSVASSLSSFYSIERMMGVEEEEADTDTDTGIGAAGPTMQLVITWYPRVAGAITFLSALCMLCMAWKRRNLLFHRLVLGMSFHLMVFGACYIVGALAIPSDDTNINQFGNIGNVATCTTQGFLIYVSARVAVLYYCSFSVYSYVGVLNNFDKTTYQWCEKWIHGLVHIFPIGMASYFLAIKGFNAGYGMCKRNSYPLDCDLSDDIPCERGPDTYGGIQAILYLVIYILCMALFPTFVMTALYCKVKKREQQQQQQTQTQTQTTQPVCIMQAKKVLLQSCVYLSALYWTLSPFLVVGMMNLSMRGGGKSTNGLIPYKMFAQINYALFGLWSMLTYRYFSVVGSSASRRSTTDNDNNNDNDNNKHENNDNGGISETTTNQHSENNSMINTSTTEYIFNAEEQQQQQQQPGVAVIENENSSCPPISTTTAATAARVIERQYSVNIFDGTNAKGAFADFIHDGDSDDELADIEEAAHWSAVQDQI